MFETVLVLISIGAVIGIWLGTNPHSISLSIVMVIILFGTSFVAVSRHVYVRAAGVVLISIALGMIWGGRAATDDVNARSIWEPYADRVIHMNGVLNYQEKRGDSIRYRVGTISMDDTVFLPGQVEFWVPFSDPIRKGSEVSIHGKIEIPNEIADTGTFRPAEYYARYDVYALVRNPSVVVLNEPSKQMGLIAKTRLLLHNRLIRLISEPSAGLLAAVLFGDRSGIPPEMRDEFATAGVAHLIAISGLHVGLFAAGTIYACGMLGLHRIVSSVLAAGLATLFVMFAGFPPSGIRALIMIFVFLCAYATSRRVHATRALLFAAVLMAIVEPRIVRADVGFQLSVAAMWGIVAWYPIIRYWVPTHSVLRGMGVIVCVTLSAMFITAPAVAYTFGQVSLIGLIVNVIVAPIFPLLMIGGVVVLVIGNVPFIGSSIIAMVDLLSSFLLWIISRASSVPWAAFEIEIFSSNVMIILYAVLFLFPIMYVPEIRAQFIPRKASSRL